MALYRRIGWRVLPILLACCIIANITRFNIGLAKLQFLADLGLNDAILGMAASSFYVGYLLFLVPSSLLVARLGARRMLLYMMTGWGVVTGLFAFVHAAEHLYLLRFLLGVAQAGFFPGMIFYLTLWFPAGLRGRINNTFTTAFPIAGIVGAPIAGQIMERLNDVYGLRGWQWLFLLQAASAIAVGIVAYAYLNDNPETSNFLSDQEKAAVIADRSLRPSGRPFDRAGTLQSVLRDHNIWLFGSIYFGYFCCLNAISLWGPSLLAETGIPSIATVGWLSGSLAGVSTVGMITIGSISDRLGERRWHVASCGIIASTAIFLLPLTHDDIALTAGLLFFATTGLYSILGLFWTIPTAYLPEKARAGGIAVINTFGVLGGIVSPSLVGWLVVETGSLYTGVSVTAVLLLSSLAALLCFAPVARGAASAAAKFDHI